MENRWDQQPRSFKSPVDITRGLTSTFLFKNRYKRLGTPEERRLASLKLYNACRDAFSYHAQFVGMAKQEDATYRLVYHPDTVEKLFLDRSIGSAYRLTTVEARKPEPGSNQEKTYTNTLFVENDTVREETGLHIVHFPAGTTVPDEPPAETDHRTRRVQFGASEIEAVAEFLQLLQPVIDRDAATYPY